MRMVPHSLALVATLGLGLSGCDVGMKSWAQTGYRGTGGDQIRDTSEAKALAKLQVVPPPPYPLEPAMLGGERAGQTYQNVKVLNNISTEQFNYIMAAMVTWIAPGDAETQGCNYCHNPANMASDEKYTKVVARRMIQMTQSINGAWGKHVSPAGVTCWTCHRGNGVPVNKWAIDPKGGDDSTVLMGNKRGQNTPLKTVAYASLPSDPFSSYLRDNQEIRLAGATPYPVSSAPVVVSGGTKHAEKTYGLMMHMSSALGVNCTYCHNAGNFQSWNLSKPQRATAWYGIRMVRNINNAYIEPLAAVFPAYRKGHLGDPYKVNCLTCHQGVAKPMNGYPMLKDYPGLKGPLAPMTVAAASPNWHAPLGPDSVRSLNPQPLPPVATVAMAPIPANAGAAETTIDGVDPSVARHPENGVQH
ncbi:photosynthetic reaction center cytochrome c subunit [Sphingosinicellaceae bacterium]|nr:photosynthetic reaction center cytochrome c subunit [Sphingosinicellaceae bacterium]